MKNSTLLFRSLAIIILIAGSAHLVRLGNSYTADESIYDSSNYPQKPTEVITNKGITEGSSQRETNQEKTYQYNQETDYLIGKWIVSYTSDDFNGSIVYTLKKENNVFNAYTEAYQDEKGNAIKAEKSQILTINKFDGYKGSGIYKVEYEGETYDVKCTINMVDENTFKLVYDYYGYGDTETWKRQ